MSPLRFGLPLLILAQALGIFLADRIQMPSLGILWTGAALLALYGLSRPWALGRLMIALGLAFCAGAFSLAIRSAPALLPSAGFVRDQVVEATVCDSPTYSDVSVSVILCSAFRLPGPGQKVDSGSRSAEAMPGLLLRAYQGEDEYEALTRLGAGQRIRAFLRLRPMEASRNPGGRDERAQRRRQGLGFKARLLHPFLLVRLFDPESRTEAGGATGLWRLRERSAEALIQTGSTCIRYRETEACGGALLGALALGDRRGLTPSVKEAFSRLGLSHLLAVSGLHLVLIAGISYRGFLFLATRLVGRRAYRDRRPWALGCAILLALGYAVWAGFGVPVQRAWILLLVWIPVGWLKRRPPLGWGLFWAGFFVLSLEPAALFGLGAQLSFAATTGLLLAAHREDPGALSVRPLPLVWLLRVTRVSLVAIAFTAPFLARAGLPVGAAGLVMNLLAIPWTAIILLPAALLASGLALVGGEIATLGVAFAQTLAGWTVIVLMELAALWPPLPLAGPASWWSVGVAAVLALLIVWESNLLRALGLFGCLLAWLLGSPSGPLEPGFPRVVMFDVGQGDAILLQGRRAAVLVDAGRSFSSGGDMGRSVVAPGLRALGVGRLDALVASHADLDHRGGLRHILTQFEVGEVWLPATMRGRAAFEDLRAVARRRGIPVLELGAGQASRTVGDLVFEPLWPPADSMDESTNENSLVLRAQIAGHRILLTGDIGASTEQALLAQGVSLEADILKVAHHGSANSSTTPFLEAVGAAFSLVSASCSGFSGLPSDRALGRLASRGSAIGWTGRDGALLVDFATEAKAHMGMRLRSWAEPRDCPVGEGRVRSELARTP